MRQKPKRELKTAADGIKVAKNPFSYPIEPEGSTPLSFRLTALAPVFNERHVVEASLERLLHLHSELISALEVIVVDDCSTDGTWETLQRIASRDPRVVLLRHQRNQGKGAAVRTAVEAATGDVCVIYDADLEYNAEDIPALLLPFALEGADAVFGSRYMSGQYRRALLHRHTTMNKALTSIGNWLTDLSISDIETGFKAINTTLLKSIPIRSNDFRFEVEIVFKLAKRRARVFEAPIRYVPRTREEGKKIRARDGILAVLAMFRFWLQDDLYKEDEYGSHILVEIERTRRFNLWMGQVLRPFVGERILELGAGIGTLTSQFIPREFYLASDVNPNYLHYLKSYSFGKPYLQVSKIAAEDPADFAGLESEFDTVLMVSVLEHVKDERQAFRNVWSALSPGGRVVVLAPQHPGLYGSLDTALGHQKRYTVEELNTALTESGFAVEAVVNFNRFAVPGWWVNGTVLKRKGFSRLQLKIVDVLMPLLKRVDRFLPWGGLSIVAIGVKPSQRGTASEGVSK
ncbi:MAG TPA: glycosyltransferase [Blastocatellia bacterium]|nr:glycosyltransferase [Blastocatellia bacterium]